MTVEQAAVEYVTGAHRSARMRVQALVLKGRLLSAETAPEVERLLARLRDVERDRREAERMVEAAWRVLAAAHEVPASTEPWWRTFAETSRSR